MSDINKTFNDWQKKDIKHLKSIRQTYEKENNTIFKIVLIGVIAFVVFLFYNS